MSSYLNLIKIQKYDESLLSTLQFLSDIMVHCLKPENKEGIIHNYSQDREPYTAYDESETLLLTINAQSERIAKLNKQISEAMISSKVLLYSPLATVNRKENRASKSSCFTPSYVSKPLFSTPERWRMKKDIIVESNPDEEVSGKPLN